MHIHEYVCLDCGARFYPTRQRQGSGGVLTCGACGSGNAYRSHTLVPTFLLADTSTASNSREPDGRPTGHS
jgi:DNA-directed RNA polymerase subunit RPC12/RpoP